VKHKPFKIMVIVVAHFSQNDEVFYNYLDVYIYIYIYIYILLCVVFFYPCVPLSFICYKVYEFTETFLFKKN
jgi:hypothetical protein